MPPWPRVRDMGLKTFTHDRSGTYFRVFPLQHEIPTATTTNKAHALSGSSSMRRARPASSPTGNAPSEAGSAALPR